MRNSTVTSLVTGIQSTVRSGVARGGEVNAVHASKIERKIAFINSRKVSD